MRVLMLGATGMVGQGVLLECLRSPAVGHVLIVGRTPVGCKDPKVREIVRTDLGSYTGLESALAGFDACFFCLGVSSTGMSEEAYTRTTYGLTLAAAECLSRLNPGMTFIYVSGAGTDSSEKGRSMWARVKGRTENALLTLPLKAYMFRPGFIEPLDGIRSKTRLYAAFYKVLGPVLPALRRMAPNAMLTTRQIGQAMLRVAQRGYPRRILESGDIREAAG